MTLTTAACGGPSIPPPQVPSGELADLHDRVRVPGLDDRRFGHEAYWAAIDPYLGSGVLVEEAGKSAEGRAIRSLTFGDGPTTVLLWSQMHGDESTASMALADLARLFHQMPEHPVVGRIREGVTVHMIPMLNPDGAERFRRRNAQGVDVNRDARRLETPEGQTLKAVRDRVEPDFGFNLHDQSTAIRVGSSDHGVAIALLAPAFNESRDVDDKRRRAMRVAVVLRQAMAPLVDDRIAKYDDAFNPRAFGDLMGAWGASTVLIESGGWPDDPQKQHLRKTNFVGLVAALDAIATGAYEAYDTRAYEDLEYNGRRVADLLIRGGTVVLPGMPPLAADLLITYDRPLLRDGGTISDVGDLDGTEAQDTMDVTGLFIHPLEPAMGADGGIDTGAPAHFLITEDREGRQVRVRFEGAPDGGR